LKRALAILPLVALVGAVVLFAGYALRHDPHVETAALVGRPTPDVRLPRLAGGAPAPLRTAAGGGPVMINFFASWCAPCALEQPHLLALQAQGVRIIGIAWKDDPAATQRFLQRLGNPYSEVLVDRSGAAGIEFGVSGVPETFMVGTNGVITAKVSRPMAAADAERLLRSAGR
jgi:cytochrome c biogenesis protein CcmG/thiol:disulfide interchange protein DsbE